MKFDEKYKFVSRVFAIVLALTMAVPVSAMFSVNVTAEANDYSTPLFENPHGNIIFENETEPPELPEVVRPENYLLPEIPDNITYEEPELPVFEHIEEPYNITLVTMESPTGPLYEGKKKPIHVVLRNKADHNIKNINVEIYDQLDDGEPVFLTDLHYGCIPKEKDQKKTFTWQPEAGTHSLTLNIFYMDNSIEQMNEEEFGYNVLPMDTPQIPSNSPITVPPGETWTWTGDLLHDDAIYIYGTLILDNCRLTLNYPSDNAYQIIVYNGGTLEVLGDSLITATTSLFQSYGFEVYV